MSGRLWVIPVPIGELAPEASLPAVTLQRVRALDYFITESAKSARAFLGALGTERPLQRIDIHELPREADRTSADRLLDPVDAGRDAGVLSESGAPAIADPGAPLIARAHERRIRVIPCVGPSSLLLALMASGLEGQRFAFHGYLPVDRPALAAALKFLERDSAREARTQLWIETPYRNERMRDAALEALQPGTRLCIACDLTGAGEWVRSAAVVDWRADRGPSIERRPAVFLMQAASSPSGPPPTGAVRAARPARRVTAGATRSRRS